MTTQSPEPAVPARKSRAGRNLPAAIAVGLALAAYAAATLLWWHWGFILLIAIALSLGAVEVHRAMLLIGMRSAIAPVVVGTFAMVVGSYATAVYPLLGLTWQSYIIVTLGCTALAAMIWRMRGGAKGYVKDAAASLFLVGYLPLMGSFMALLLADNDGAMRTLAYIACIVATDTGGYIFGVLFGKHKMAEKISPKKTWEGFAGSIVSAAVMGSLFTVFALHAQWWIGVVLGVLMVIFGTCGDLIESLIKRDVGIKDMSDFLPGHGGVMDRLDSMLVGAPVAWIVLHLLVP